ncbi:MAG: S-layer protein, partial [Planctomycetota bacterium]
MLLLLTVGLVAPVVASAEQTLTRGELQLLPRTFTLSGPVARQRLSLVGRVDAGEADGQVGPIVDRQTYTLRSSDPSVVRIDGSHAVVVGDGKAQIIAESKAGVQSTADVMVEDASARHRWSFRNDVQSVLARQGCNMGACHGALAGKGGFRLSLRGYDCEADFFTITRQA